ncbi:acylneuraminate cytidylyltransferase [Lachnospiraceae bacterium OttesenSCG-928-D06]|nr:acylneuraminate cytidylyltransferase [Lachnospiraceae bacterium OttesenSCG-928-D06]
MKIVSVIPIKLNNERLANKNTKLLGEFPLIEYSQKCLLEVDEIDERYVFCSDESITKYLLPNIHFLQRDQALDLPTANFSQIFESFSSIVQADIYIYAHATAPFISADTIKECISAVKSKEFDSAFCAIKIQDFLWSNGNPLNFDGRNIPRSQDLEPIYRETSGVYVFNQKVFHDLHRRVGNCPFIKELDFKESIDINNPEDFRLAEIMLKH